MADPHVTVPDESPYLEQAVTTPASDTFNITWTVFGKADLRVAVDGVELTQGEFAFDGNAGTLGGFDGGAVVLTSAVANALVQIWSDITPARLGDFIEGRRVSMTTLNTELDKLWARMRDTRLRIQRAPVFRWQADHQLEEKESGNVNTNEDAAGAFALTLPAASTGLGYIFIVVEAFVLTVNGGSIINGDEAGTSIASDVIGSTLALLAINDTQWVALWMNGTWTVT